MLAAATVLASMTVATLAVAPSTASPVAATVATTVATTTETEQGVTVRGAVGDRGAISRARLQDLTQRKVASRYQTSGGPQSHLYTGPLLLDVLNSVEPNFSSDRHDMLRYAILLEAADGFLAALAWGEIDPELAHKKAIVALTEDGKALGRPRLVVPGDTHGARQVYDLATIFLLRLSPELAEGSAGRIESGSPGHGGH
jgi:hypothetical protein